MFITIEKPSEDGKVKVLRYCVSEELFDRIETMLNETGERPFELPASPLSSTTEQLMTAMIPMLTGRSKTIIYDMSEKPDNKELAEVLAIYQNFNFVCVDGKGKERLNTTVAAF